jgi:hypothetical protein
MADTLHRNDGNQLQRTMGNIPKAETPKTAISSLFSIK